MSSETIGQNHAAATAADARAQSQSRLPSARMLARLGMAGIAVTLLVFGALHLLPPTSAISPLRRTISEYALTSSAWAFDLGVIALSASSVAVLAALVLLRRIRMFSSATLFGTIWVLCLLTLVSFPKHNWALGGPSSSGQIHRLASLVAFIALPIVALVVGRRRRSASAPGSTAAVSVQPASARWTFWLGVLSLVWFSPMLWAVFTAPITGTPWWQAIPLGLVERGLALTEVAAVLTMAFLVLRTSRSEVDDRPGADRPGDDRLNDAERLPTR